ncbi:MAG: VOC family protein [Sandaracinaceae bacterium]|nr:VOC family protein [Sandaracinaceae bacterium]
MYESHRFCWHGVVSSEPDEAASFYSKVLGWKLVDIRIGRGASRAFEAGGAPIAHLTRTQPGVSSHWACFLRDESIDGRASLAVMNGGSVIVPPTDIGAGRVSVLASPSGARLYLLHEVDESSQHHPGGVGGVEWVDLQSTDLERDLAWLTSTFRFQTSSRAAGAYATLSYKGQPRAGATQSCLPALPPMWIAWISVADAEAVVQKAERCAGRALVPLSDATGGGRWCVLADGTGTVFGVVERKGVARE